MSQETFDRVRALVAETLRVGVEEIDAGTCSANQDRWDSLAHMMILAAVERAFGVKLPRLESYTVANVGELVALLERSLATSAASAAPRPGG